MLLFVFFFYYLDNKADLGSYLFAKDYSNDGPLIVAH